MHWFIVVIGLRGVLQIIDNFRRSSQNTRRPYSQELFQAEARKISPVNPWRRTAHLGACKWRYRFSMFYLGFSYFQIHNHVCLLYVKILVLALAEMNYSYFASWFLKFYCDYVLYINFDWSHFWHGLWQSMTAFMIVTRTFWRPYFT